MTPTGERPPYSLDKIPVEIRNVAHWCVFRLVWNERKGKFSKLPTRLETHATEPLRPNPSSGQPSRKQWRPTKPGHFAAGDDDVGIEPQPADGVGWFFTLPFFGYDIDGVRDADTGEIEPEAEGFIRRHATYVEVSVSGNGVHGVGHGIAPEIEVPIDLEKPDGPKRNKPAWFKGLKYEVYAAGRGSSPSQAGTWPHHPRGSPVPE